jgi:hypothetical protein
MKDLTSRESEFLLYTAPKGPFGNYLPRLRHKFCPLRNYTIKSRLMGK